ncbi:hypothetical protein A5634_24420 [Mycobacterium asiaticum]|uniref:DUF4189 domain-containing protein n=1 Tax=Mycobacterium asiaticum TaxID=1790 RepID=A0A1A3P2M6_MYCAS|nr:DUF4189 domain-containing protein [Mycobacterium asiaticum]OBK26832.1 hypothetical protein A5634_24420 [Mycobacterium asiaticum]
MTTRQRRRVPLLLASVLAAAAMAFTLIHPAAARTHPHNLPPLLTYYGAFAYSNDGASGTARRQKNRSLAERLALERCGVDSCRIVSSYTQCGAVAHDGATYHGGYGPTRQAAEQHAVANLGGGWPVIWACH